MNSTVVQSNDGGLSYVYTGSVNTETVGQSTDENKARHIEIDQLNGGYNIRVGCHQFAFETHEKMLKHLTAYLKNPQEVEKKWFGKKLDLTK